MKLILKITGPKVHDVGYRAFLLDSAEDACLSGFQARNMIENGIQTVVGLLEGDDMAVAEFRRLVQEQKPETASISSFAFEDYAGSVEDIQVFSGKFQARQLRKGISAIIRIEKTQNNMLDLQYKMLEKLDTTNEKLDTTNEKLDSMDKKLDSMDKKLDVTNEKLDSMDKKLDVTNEKLDSIDKKVDVTNEKLDTVREDIVTEVRELRRDMKSSLEERLDRLEGDMAQIKAKIGL